MTEEQPTRQPADLPDELTGELVAEYQDRDGFDRAVAALVAAGFERSDLSVLATHDSLDVATEREGDEREGIEAGIAGETEFLSLVTTASLILLVSGPLGAAAAAVAGLAGGAMALQPLLHRVTQSAHATGFAEALENGAILLWVRTGDAAAVGRAAAILGETGGRNLSRLARPAREHVAEA